MFARSGSRTIGSSFSFLVIAAFIGFTESAPAADYFPANITALRLDIERANASAGLDTIHLTAGATYTFETSTTLDSARGDVNPLDGDLDITDGLVIQGNGATLDGNLLDRVFYIEGTSTSLTNVTINNLTITRGKADPSTLTAHGGGICAYLANLTVNNCTIANNTTSQNGGGVAVFGQYDRVTRTATFSSLVLITTTLSGNQAENGGGVMTCLTNLTVTTSNLTGNTALAPAATQGGGGLLATGSTVTVQVNSGCAVTGNSSGGFAGGLSLFATAPPSITGVMIAGNTAVNGGGGIHCFENSPTLTNCLVTSNSARRTGGGVNCYTQASPVILNSTFSGNRLSGSPPRGGGIYLGNDSHPSIANTIFEGSNGWAIYAESGSSPTMLAANAFDNNPSALLDLDDATSGSYEDGDVDFMNANLAYAWDNVAGSIQFQNKAAGDYHLFFPSSAHDAALSQAATGTVTLTAPSVDYEGLPRPEDLLGIGRDGAGEGYDIGAYEDRVPTFVSAPSQFAFVTFEGGPVATDTLVIANGTTWGTVLDYSIAPGASWLSIVPSSGTSTTDPTTHTVTMDPTGLNAGDYFATITVTAVEAVNNPLLVPVSLRVNNVLPAVAIDSILPNPAQPPSDIVSLAGTATDTAGVMTAHEWRSDVDGVLGSSEDIAQASNELTVGAHAITFTAWDDENTSSSDTGSLTVLDAPPTASIVSLVPNPVAAGATVNVTLAGRDNDELGLSIADGELTWPDGVHPGTLPGIHALAAPFLEGPYTIEYRVRDDEGTWSAASSATLNVVQPQIANLPTSLTVVTAEGSGLSTEPLAIWNATSPGTLDYALATSPTWLSVVPTTGTSTGGTTTHTVVIDPAGLNAGNYTGTIAITAPGANNTPVAVAVALRVTNVLPTVTIDGILPNPAQPPSDGIAFAGTAADPVGSITAHEWRSDVDGWLSAQEDFVKSSNEFTVGAHRITFTAWDDEGTSASDNASLTILDALPTATIVSLVPNPVAAGDTVTVTLAGQDNDELGQSLVEGELTWPDGVHPGILPGIHTFAAPLLEGPYAIAYRVRDDEGTWSAASRATLDVVQPQIANSPTSMSVQTTEGGLVVTEPLTVWNGTSPGTLDYAISATPAWLSVVPTTGTSTGGVTTHTVSVDPTGLNADDHGGTIAITAPGANNTPVFVPVLLRVANVLPAVSIDAITPNPAQPPADEVDFTGTATDAAGSIVSHEWRSDLDGLLSVSEDFSRSSNELTVGNHAVTFTAWDDEGSSGSDVALLAILDAPPTATIVSLAPNPVAAGATVTATLAGQDNDELAQSLVDGELTWPDGPHGGILPGSHAFAAPALESDYMIAYRVRDDEGGWSAQSTATLRVVQPQIAHLPASIAVQTTEGSGVSTEPLAVWNGTPFGTLVYALATTPTWLSISPTTGTSTGLVTTHTVFIDAAGLNSDDYGGTITITAPASSNTPVSVPVMLRVGNVAPSVAIDSIAPNPAQPPSDVVDFQGSAADAAGAITAHEWRSNLDGLLSIDEDFSTLSHVLTVGTHAITFTAWDDEGSSAGDSASLEILNALATATIVSMTPNPVPAGATVTLALAGQDNDEVNQTIVDGRLTWPDGEHTGILPGVYERIAPTVGGDYAIEYAVLDDEGVWSTTGTDTLRVEMPGAPFLAAEPAFHRGTANTIWFLPAAGTVASYLEWATDPAFANVVGNSGWLPVPQGSYTARDLLHGQIYYYRVKGRNVVLVEGPWSAVVSSTQDAMPPETAAGALPPYTSATVFIIPWTGSDSVSGLASVRLYYRRGYGSTFYPYGGAFTASPIVFDAGLTGGDGLYLFYTIGTDNVGNRERVSPVPDARITVRTMPPPPPIVASEAPFHWGSVNTIWFAPPATADACFMEWSSGPLFSRVVGNSGWLAVPQSNFTARGLQDGVTYYYRVKARNEYGEGDWSVVVSATQDQSPPESHVVGDLPRETRSSTFTINSVAFDAISGVREVRLYYRHEGSGPFVEWPEAFTSNTLLFDASSAGGDGLYEFYSIAEDRVGNLESAPPTPDAMTVVRTTTRATRWRFYR